MRCLTPGPALRADYAKRIARALGVSTDLFLDVLRVYTGWPDNRKPKSKRLPNDVSSKVQQSPQSVTVRQSSHGATTIVEPEPNCTAIGERLEEEKH